MKKLFEKIVEGILACSGFVTSITIVLIILFLFSEALGLFNSRVIEEGYVLALNKDNKVTELTPAQIKDVFDEEITNWNEVGGQDMPIRLFRLEDITRYYTEEELGPSYEHAGARITELVERTPGIIAFVPQQFIVRQDSVHLLRDNTILPARPLSPTGKSNTFCMSGTMTINPKKPYTTDGIPLSNSIIGFKRLRTLGFATSDI